MTGQAPDPADLPVSARLQLTGASRAEPPGDLLDAVLAEVRTTRQLSWFGIPRLVLAVGGGLVVVVAMLLIARSSLPPPATSGVPAGFPSGAAMSIKVTVVDGIAGRPVGWSSDGSYFAVVQEGDAGFVDVYSAEGRRLREVEGEDATWLGPDTIAIFQLDPGSLAPGVGRMVFLHVYSGSLERVEGTFSGRPVGSPASGRLAVSDARAQPFSFQLLGEARHYAGYPLAWDSSGRYLAIREETAEVGPAVAMPLVVLDAQTGRLMHTGATIDAQNASLDASGSVATGVRLADQDRFALVRLDGSLVRSSITDPIGSDQLPYGRWLVNAGGDVYVWDPANPGVPRKIAFGSAAASKDGVVAVVRRPDDPPPPRATRGDPLIITIAGPALYGPSWSPTGRRLLYVNSDSREIRLVVLQP